MAKYTLENPQLVSYYSVADDLESAALHDHPEYVIIGEKILNLHLLEIGSDTALERFAGVRFRIACKPVSHKAKGSFSNS